MPAKIRLADFPSFLRYGPKLVLYPLRPAALGALLLFTALTRVGLEGIWGIPLLAIGIPWFMAYLDSVIETTASGEAEPPIMGAQHIDLVSPRGWRMLFGPLILIWIGWSRRTALDDVSTLLVVVSAVLLPIYWMLCAVEGWLRALNPMRQGQALLALGFGYWLLIGFVALVWTLVWRFGGASVLILLAGLAYCFLLLAHGLGYLAYSRADQLGISVTYAASHEELAAHERQQALLDSVLRMVDEALRRGNIDDAIGSLLVPRDDLLAPIRFEQELFSRLHDRGSKRVILAQGQRLITTLVQDRNFLQALDVYRQCLDLIANFELAQTSVATILARHALQLQRHDDFDALTRKALEQDDDGAVERAYLRAGWLLDQRQDDGAARKLLGALGQRVNGHPLQGKIEALGQVLGL